MAQPAERGVPEKETWPGGPQKTWESGALGMVEGRMSHGAKQGHWLEHQGSLPSLCSQLVPFSQTRKGRGQEGGSHPRNSTRKCWSQGHHELQQMGVKHWHKTGRSDYILHTEEGIISLLPQLSFLNGKSQDITQLSSLTPTMD